LHIATPASAGEKEEEQAMPGRVAARVTPAACQERDRPFWGNLGYVSQSGSRGLNAGAGYGGPSEASMASSTFDVVIRNGQVIDVETGFDGVRNVGVKAGKIATITRQPLEGCTTIDGSDHVVTAGFIDQHFHWTRPMGYKLALRDGVTSAMDLASVARHAAGGASIMTARFDELLDTARRTMGVVRVPGVALGVLHEDTVESAGIGITNVDIRSRSLSGPCSTSDPPPSPSPRPWRSS
jgi:hypothetical protein